MTERDRTREAQEETLTKKGSQSKWQRLLQRNKNPGEAEIATKHFLTQLRSAQLPSHYFIPLYCH